MKNNINDAIKKFKNKYKKFSWYICDEEDEELLSIIDDNLQVLCEGNIFYIKIVGNEIFVIAKESKDILKLKNVIKENELDIYCCDISDYQSKFLHNISFRSKHLKTEKCGCFNCLTIFNSSELDNDGEIGGWCDFNDTPVCPYCGVDSILFEGKTLKIDRKLLYDMELNWFGIQYDLENWKEPEKPTVISLDI